MKKCFGQERIYYVKVIKEEYKKQEEELRIRTQNGSFTFYPNKLKWSNVVFDWEKSEMCFTIPAGEFTLGFSEGAGMVQTFLNTGFKCICKGYWKMGHFILEAHMVDEEQGNVRMDFAWKGNRMSLRSVATNDPFVKEPSMKKYFHGFAAAEIV